MQCEKLIVWIAFLIIWCDGQLVESDQIKENLNDRHERYRQSRNEQTSKSSYSLLSESISQVSHESAVDSCNDDIACLALASTDKLGLEAIRDLHQQLDDDANGNIDLSESDDFLREELKYDSGYEKRQRAFHRNDDMHISVRELWEAWLKSEVHNWTVEQTSEWLAINVDLPQYVPNFIQHRVNGATLPRLAVNNMYYLSNVIGIKDPIHKQKIALKAMDVVLFGSPKDSQSLWKDLTLVTLLFGAIVGVWYTYLQRKKSRLHLIRMMKDMESLQRAELALEELQKELERAKLAQENVATEKQNLEKKLQEAGGDSMSLHTSYSDLEVSQLKAEIEMLRTELQIAEGELKDRCWSPPLGLQQWLQLTHEIENKSYLKKKISAEKQLQQAREACEKLRKKRTSLVGAFVSTHGKSIDDVDRSIVEARTSLNEVTQELQERVHRWKQIELLCGFNIINNNGLQFLEGVLYRNNGRPGLKGRISSSQDDLDDDTSSIYTSCAGCAESNTWKESADSSGSEASKQDDESSGEFRNPSNNVHFTVGGETANWGSEDHIAKDHSREHSKDFSRDHPKDHVTTREISKDHVTTREHPKDHVTVREHPKNTATTVVAVYNRPQSQPPPSKVNNNNNIMVRSQSHDININADHIVPLLNKQSQSESNLDTHQPISSSRNVSLRQKTIKEQTVVDEENCSTDSTSSTVDEEIKKRRRKLFPTFNKKNKSEKEKSDKSKEKTKVSD